MKRLLTKMRMPSGVAPRWRKNYKGQRYYFRGSYQDALRLWEAKKVELDGPSYPPEDAHLHPDFSKWEYELAHRKFTTATLGGAVAEWIAARQVQLTMGQLRPTTVEATALNVGRFAKWAGEGMPLEKITERLLENFFAHLAGEIEAGRLAKKSAQQTMIYTKAFIRRQWELRRIELPRNLTSKTLSITVPAPTVTVMSVETIADFYKKARPFLKTCILLTLNTGMLQVDLADLRQDEVDWEKGTITKKRSKTSNHASAPTVCWKLWDTTLTLLKAHRGDGERVLTGKGGRHLMLTNGKRNDLIGKLWQYNGGGGKGKEYKNLRKVSASLLASHPEYGRYAQYFLGHAPSSIADRHYIKPSQEQFDKAVEWLGTQFVNLEG